MSGESFKYEIYNQDTSFLDIDAVPMTRSEGCPCEIFSFWALSKQIFNPPSISGGNKFRDLPGKN